MSRFTPYLDALEQMSTPHPDARLVRGWRGWGPVAPLIDRMHDLEDTTPDVVRMRELGALFSPENIDNSFYTPETVIDACWKLACATGIDGGAALEPGCGSGLFIAADPVGFHWTGIESDPLAARMARLLNPAAVIAERPYESLVHAPGRYDLVIGNVPFANTRVWDEQTHLPTDSVHQYFITRALTELRRDGRMVVIVSRHMLDAYKNADALARHGYLETAVRLPSGVFDGTDVVADILVLRPGADNASRLTGWFDSHPELVAGEASETGWHNSIRVDGDTTDIHTALGHALRMVSRAPARTRISADVPDAPVAVADAAGRPIGSFQITADGIVEITADGAVGVRESKELRALVELRDLAVRLLDAETDDTPDLEAIRTQTREAYEAYVARWGALGRGNMSEGRIDPETGLAQLNWRRPAMGGFRRDPDAALVLALEVFDQDTGEARPAPILLHRVNHAPVPATRADTPADALAISRGEGRGIDLDRIAELLGTDVPTALEQLSGLVFRDPVNDELVTADEYLSGDVATKLAAAEAAGAHANVLALREVVPPRLTELDVTVRPGASWVPTSVVSDFTAEVFGSRSSVSREVTTGRWSVEGGWAAGDARIHFGTEDRDPQQLLEHLLNNTSPVIVREVPNPEDMWGRPLKVRDQRATLACEEQMEAISARFTTWMWEDGDRAERVLDIYNERFNSFVPRSFDGSWLSFPGMSADFTPWDHQRRMVERVISQPRVLCGHPVGAGKTSTSIMAAVTLRQLGLASKPLIAVPNHLLEQYAREAHQLYPTGRFLVATKEDLSADRRRLFAARCATGDWDAVIMTHQAFSSLPLSAAADERVTQLQCDQAMDRVYAAGRVNVKREEKAIRRFRAQARKLSDGVADAQQVHFDQLGVDHITIDEAHMFKRLDVDAGRDQGFASGSSKRAWDLQRKIEWLASRRGDRPVVALMTGTPWSNSIVETFVWQRLLQPDRLVRAEVANFPAWAATFVRFESQVEVSPDGSSFRLQRRPAVIQNLPELMGMFADVADVLTPEQIGLARPDHTETTVEVDPTDEQDTFVRELAERSEKIHSGSVDPADDNMLLVCNDGRKVALDPQLVGLADVSPKVDAAVERIARIWSDTRERVYGSRLKPGALQVVFCDLGTPGDRGDQTYGRLRSGLVAAGVPAEQIRFIHDARTGRQRDALFQQCRDGDVAVLIGSTEKMGTGTNIQDRLVAVHHMDPPWRPSDITQREGRALRPGNLNDHVEIYRYVARGTFDSYSFQTLERKARFIAQLMGASSGQREVEDIAESVLTFSQVKAIATGNPMLLEHARLRSEVRRLQVLRAVQSQGAARARKESVALASEAKRLGTEARAYETLLRRIQPAPEDPRAERERFVWALRRMFEYNAGYASATVRGISVDLSRPVPGAPVTMRTRIGSITLEIGTFTSRGSDAERAATSARRVFDAWVTRSVCAEAIETLHARSASALAQSEERARAAENFVFAQQVQLDQCVRDLAAVERALEAAAAPAEIPNEPAVGAPEKIKVAA